MVASKKVCPCPNPQNLWILPHMAKEWVLHYMTIDVIKSRILSWGNYLRLSRWVLNASSSVFTRKRQREIRWKRRGQRHTEKATWGQRLEWCGMRPRNGEECQEPPEGGREKEEILPWSLQRGWGPADILVSGFWHLGFRFLASRTVIE